MKLHSKIIGKGRPLIILHGFLGMGDNWKTLANQYSDEGFEVHLVDQRNHGRSPHDEAFSYELLAEDLKDYFEQKSLDKACIIGHSMGGKTAMMFATMFSKKVEKLIVVDIAPKYYSPHHQDILQGLSAISNAELTSRSDADELLGKYIKIKSVRQFLLKNLYWKTKEKLALRMNLDALKANIDELGKSIPNNLTYDGDVLFIKGENSDYILEDDHEMISKHFKNNTIKVISNAGHWVHAEQRKTFFETSMKFLEV
ncbi:alpha/beta fold hydrolase [Psychroflexus aestuariivivens]|uniref:alpha/beta fold hydrolase n=1 Tax=Psychroflexus aestuariivivens TaxID=1795040 RepID=UPI000FD75763|nr:alpha/beta fold hydrolase [Psychroflexus aestuariivivens]